MNEAERVERIAMALDTAAEWIERAMAIREAAPAQLVADQFAFVFERIGVAQSALWALDDAHPARAAVCDVRAIACIALASALEVGRA